MTIKLNFRKAFIPDPGFTLIEGDFERAESQVVAWESNDAELKSIFASGRDIHKENAEWIYQVPSNYYRRDKAKRCIYAIQNGGRAPKIGELLNDMNKGHRFYDYWTGRFPSITKWHDKLLYTVETARSISNVWGYKNPWLDRISLSIIGDLVPWVTQSTIGIGINKCLLNIEEQLPEVQLLMQVHDSLIMQAPTARLAALMPKLREAMHIVIPYDDPLVIPIDFKTSEKSWGEAEKVK